jgi:integrase/recombinase XerD
MLGAYFKYQGVLRRIRQGPLADEIDRLASAFERDGYSRESARRHLSLAGTFNRYAAQKGLTKGEIDSAIGEDFLEQVRMSEGMRIQAKTVVGHVLRRLGHRYPWGCRDPIIGGPHASLLMRLDAYLGEVRGLQARSREEVVRAARRMLEWYHGLRPRRRLSGLAGKDILTYIAQVATASRTRRTTAAALSHVRNFLRWLRWEGLIREDLARLVPRVPSWRLATIPSHLEWSQVRTTIDAIDTSTPVGKRDRALMLVLATTGLRSQEVRRLQLDDISWRTRELRVKRTKTNRERIVPLLDEAGRALADYVLHGRPLAKEATVFLRHTPPGVTSLRSSTLARMVRARLARCGIHPLRAGAHLLRHSLATRMVQQRRPIKEVADLLGHGSIDTTAIYVKVALPQLQSVALPLPGDLT